MCSWTTCSFSEMSMMVESLPIFYTQRDNLFYSAWAFALPTTLLRIPYSLLESFLWSIIVYWSVGLAPTAARFFTFWLLLFLSHQVGLAFLAFQNPSEKVKDGNTCAADHAPVHPLLLSGFISVINNCLLECYPRP